MLLLTAVGIEAQPAASPLFQDANSAYVRLDSQFIKRSTPVIETNLLSANPNLYCIVGTAATDSTLVGILVKNDGGSHHHYYKRLHDQRGYVQFPNRDTWVFALNELDSCWADFSNKSQPKSKCLSQILGLPDTDARDTIVILKVRNSDLFRPAYDKDITKQVLQRPDNKYPLSSLPGTPIDTFLLNQVVTNTMPWTRMGYTYNWGTTNNNYFGLAEFILPKGKRARYVDYRLVNSLP